MEMENLLKEEIEIKDEIFDEEIEVDDVFDEDPNPVSLSENPKIVNAPVVVSTPKQLKVSQPVNANTNNFKNKPGISKKSNLSSGPDIKCMVDGCPTKGRSEETNYFCLTEKRYDSWIKALGEDPARIKLDKKAPYKYLVCNKHFRHCDFRGRQKIIDDAVPSQNIPRKAETVPVAPHKIMVIEDIVELDEQSQNLCYTVYQKIKETDIPPGKNKLQQVALLCGISYHTMKKILKSRSDARTKTTSLVTAILQIEKLNGGEIPTVDFYYKQLRKYPKISCSKKKLLHWLKLTGVNFKDPKNAVKNLTIAEPPIIVLDQSDEEVEARAEIPNKELQKPGPSIASKGIESVNNIEALIVDEEPTKNNGKHVPPLFINVKEANLLHVLPKIFEANKTEGKTPTLNFFYLKVFEMTKELHSKSTLKKWLDQLDIKYEEDPAPTNVEKVKEPEKEKDKVIEVVEEDEDDPEPMVDMDIEELIDKEPLEEQTNVQPLFVTLTEANLLHLLPKIYEPFKIEDKVPSFDYYYSTVFEISKETCNKDTLKQWLEHLNIKYETEQVPENASEAPPMIKSTLVTVYNLFYVQNGHSKLPTLQYLYDNLKKSAEAEKYTFTKSTLIRWLCALAIKFEINEDIILMPTLAYFEGQLTLRDHAYSKETVSHWLNHLKIPFKEQENYVEVEKLPEELPEVIQLLLIHVNKEFYKASPTTRLDPVIAQILRDIDNNFKITGEAATLNNYINSLILNNGIACSKVNLVKFLNILGIKYVPEKVIKTVRKLPSLNYFIHKLASFYSQFHKKEHLRYWLKLLKIDYQQDMGEEIPASLRNNVASKLRAINMEFYSQLIDPLARKWLDLESINIINRIVDKSYIEIPSLQHIYNQLYLNGKQVTRSILKDCLTAMKVKFSEKNYLYASLIDEIKAVVKKKCRIPQLDYFFFAFNKTPPTRKRLQKWLDEIGILYYPVYLEKEQEDIEEEDELTSETTNYLIKLDRAFSKSSSSSINNILNSIGDKFIENGEIPTLNFMHNFLQSFRMFSGEDSSHYSRDVLGHWLKVLNIHFNDDISTRLDPDSVLVPTLMKFSDKFKKLTGAVCDESQLAVWLNSVGIKFKISSLRLPLVVKQPELLTQDIIDVLTRTNREVLLDNMKVQLKEIEWSFMLQNLKPGYDHLAHIMDSFNLFDNVKDPLTKKGVYLNLLQQMGVHFKDNKEFAPIILKELPQIDVPEPTSMNVPSDTVNDFPEIVISDVRSLNKVLTHSLADMNQTNPIEISDVRSLNQIPTVPIASTSRQTKNMEKETDSILISDVRSLNQTPNIRVVDPSKITDSIKTNDMEKGSETFSKPTQSFINESFFRKIEWDFTQKSKLLPLKYVQDILKEKGILFEETTLKKFLKCMGINFIDEDGIMYKKRKREELSPPQKIRTSPREKRNPELVVNLQQMTMENSRLDDTEKASSSDDENIEMSDEVFRIFTDIEYTFHRKLTIPTLDDFYEKLTSELGKPYDIHTIRQWLTNIGIKFKDR